MVVSSSAAAKQLRTAPRIFLKPDFRENLDISKSKIPKHTHIFDFSYIYILRD
ncbi:hypothetical protein OAV88_02455 [bacterium]|nr:hypothetical protein [bacterium]